MMPIPLKCPGCDFSFQVGGEFAGRRCKCPTCGAGLQVPQADECPAPECPNYSIASAASPPAAAIGSLVAVNVDEDRLNRYTSRRRNALNIPVWAWFAAGGAGLACVLAVVAYSALSPPAQPAAAEASARRANEPKLNTAPLPSVPQDGPRRVVKKPAPGANLEDVIEYVDRGIVKIDTYDGWDRNGLGSGFVIDRTGLVATNYHVVADCVKADVLFNNGVRFGVEGYVAVKPECDLAILKLNGVPNDVQPLELNLDSPRNASAVYAIGHPHDYKFTVTNGIVSALPRTKELPESSQDFLKSFMTDKPNNLWIQHNAQIAPGNSGGPLLNARGEVIGINTWVDESVKSGFAIHAQHLDAMRHDLLPNVAPLSQYRRAPEQVARQQIPSLTLSSAEIKRLFEQNAAAGWQPKNERDYEALCDLAFLVTYANSLRRRMAERPEGVPKEFEPVAEQATEVSQTLEKLPWNPEAQIEAVNTYAATSVLRHGKGVFLFGTHKKTFADKEGRKGMMLGLTGTEEDVFVPLADDTEDPPADAQFLVLGVARGVVYMGDNPLDQKEVPLVLSYTVLKVAP